MLLVACATNMKLMRSCNPSLQSSTIEGHDYLELFAGYFWGRSWITLGISQAIHQRKQISAEVQSSSVTAASENSSMQVVKSQLYPDYFTDTHSWMKTNIRLWMYTCNGTVWYPICLVWSSISSFMPVLIEMMHLMWHVAQSQQWMFSFHSQLMIAHLEMLSWSKRQLELELLHHWETVVKITVGCRTLGHV